jgi:hypothetical protein
MKHCDLVHCHLLDLSYPRLDIGIYFRCSPVAHAFLDPAPSGNETGTTCG